MPEECFAYKQTAGSSQRRVEGGGRWAEQAQVLVNIHRLNMTLLAMLLLLAHCLDKLPTVLWFRVR